MAPPAPAQSPGNSSLALALRARARQAPHHPQEAKTSSQDDLPRQKLDNFLEEFWSNFFRVSRRAVAIQTHLNAKQARLTFR